MLRLASLGSSFRFFGLAWIFKAPPIRRLRRFRPASNISLPSRRSDIAGNRKSLRREQRRDPAPLRGLPQFNRFLLNKRQQKKKDSSSSKVTMSGRWVSL